jgi:hypothetical protein
MKKKLLLLLGALVIFLTAYGQTTKHLTYDN